MTTTWDANWNWSTGLQGHQVGDAFLPERVELTAKGRRGAPDARAVFEIRHGVPEVVEFHLVAKPNGRAVRTSDMDDFLPFDGLAVNAFRQAGMLIKRDPTGRRLGATVPRDDREEWQLRASLESAQLERRGSPAAELEEVAQAYLASPRAPIKAVEDLGYSRRTAARRVREARDRGLLPPSTRSGDTRE